MSDLHSIIVELVSKVNARRLQMLASGNLSLGNITSSVVNASPSIVSASSSVVPNVFANIANTPTLVPNAF